MKNVAILGSTGSIGVNALKVIEALCDDYRVVALSTLNNVGLLARQVKEFKPKKVVVADPAAALKLKKLDAKRTEVLTGEEGLMEIASDKDIDIVVLAICGAPCLYPLLSAIKAGKHICLANKESIVIAGSIIMALSKKYKATIIPVDSEHSAIFQCLNSSKGSDVNRIYITGSGGPLLNVDKARFKSLSVKDVLNHPKWKMGKKITVDSATLMNKGLEMIEAHHLFGMPFDKIRLLIHPQAVVHSMVEFIDGAIIAQLGVTDMRIPIQYALTYPERAKAAAEMLDFSDIKELNFYSADMEKHPCLSLALGAARLGGTYPAVLNAADEVAVEAFLEKRIRFIDIPDVIEKVLKKHNAIYDPKLDDIIDTDIWAREEAFSLC